MSLHSLQQSKLGMYDPGPGTQSLFFDCSKRRPIEYEGPCFGNYGL